MQRCLPVRVSLLTPRSQLVPYCSRTYGRSLGRFGAVPPPVNSATFRTTIRGPQPLPKRTRWRGTHRRSFRRRLSGLWCGHRGCVSLVFVQRNDGAWTANRDPARVHPSSRVQVALAAQTYSRVIANHARGDLLDLGCGHVPCYAMYRPLVASVTCVDWDNTLHPNEHP